MLNTLVSEYKYLKEVECQEAGCLLYQIFEGIRPVSHDDKGQKK